MKLPATMVVNHSKVGTVGVTHHAEGTRGLFELRAYPSAVVANANGTTPGVSTSQKTF